MPRIQYTPLATPPPTHPSSPRHERAPSRPLSPLPVDLPKYSSKPSPSESSLNPDLEQGQGHERAPHSSSPDDTSAPERPRTILGRAALALQHYIACSVFCTTCLFPISFISSLVGLQLNAHPTQTSPAAETYDPLTALSTWPRLAVVVLLGSAILGFTLAPARPLVRWFDRRHPSGSDSGGFCGIVAGAVAIYGVLLFIAAPLPLGLVVLPRRVAPVPSLDLVHLWGVCTVGAEYTVGSAAVLAGIAWGAWQLMG